jgi:hypothetical protein
VVREDGKGDVVISEMEEMRAQTEEELLFYINEVGTRRLGYGL